MWLEKTGGNIIGPKIAAQPDQAAAKAGRQSLAHIDQISGQDKTGHENGGGAEQFFPLQDRPPAAKGAFNKTPGEDGRDQRQPHHGQRPAPGKFAAVDFPGKDMDRPVPEVEGIGDQTDEDRNPAAEQAAGDGAVLLASMDDQARADTGQQGPPAGKGILGRETYHGPEHEDKPRNSAEFRGHPARKPGKGTKGQERTKEQLPAPHGGKKKGRVREKTRGPEVEQQGNQGRGQENGLPPAPEFSENHNQDQGKEKVELLLHGQGPGVEQGPGLGGRGKIA